MTFTTLPFVIAFMAGLCAMPALNVYAVNAWNIGTLELEPWRAGRTSGLGRAVRFAITWMASLRNRLGLSRRSWAPIALALAVMLIVSYVVPAHAAGHVLTAAIVVGTPVEMRERREKLIHDAGELIGPSSIFKTPDDRIKFDAIMVDIEGYRVALDDVGRGDRLAEIGRSTLPEHQRQGAPAPNEEQRAAAMVKYEGVVQLYLRGVPVGDMSKEERDILRGGYRSFDAEQIGIVKSALGQESRDMSTFSGPAGGFLVAPDTRFYGQIIQAMKFFGGMEAVGSEVINTDTAGDMPIPMGDDTGNVGTIIPEAKATAHAGGTSPTLTELVMHAYLYSSKVVKVSWQMLRDPAVNVEGYVGGLLGERLARAQNTHFTTGNGSGQPYGIAAVATVGRQSAVGNTTSVPFDDTFKTVHSVDVAYRTPRCRWMMHDNSMLTLRLAKDGQGRYLWPELGNVQTGQPATLEGYGLVVNNDMAQMAASAKWASFGDHSYYKIRRVRGITIVRLNELYAESGQIGFLAFQSADGGFADAGQHPVKLLQNSAT